MARRGSTPGRGGESYAWTFDHCRDPQPRTGYVAGPLHWLLCHDTKPTKPCLVPLYGPNANCPFCRTKQPLYEFGYQPLRDVRGRPWVVGIHESHERVVSRISPRQGCRWGRLAGKCEACYVEPWPVTPDWYYWYPDLKPEADLTDWLCRLWDMRDIAPALGSFFRASDKPSPVTTAPQAEVPSPPSPVPPDLARCAREQRDGIGRKKAKQAELDQFGFPLPSVNGTGDHK